ncbi:MAG: glycosyltransferase [Bacteroidaceae bacterium]|nr:glycosyltransferase [Bacteroidaceae bacterium]
MRFSIIIPVFNRPDEVDELLQSLSGQSFRDFEVIIVEDGSTVPCQQIVEDYASRLPIQYYKIENSGPAGARNFGLTKASGEYIIFFDSDCLIPEGYFSAVEQALIERKADAFGGPDRAHTSFTPVQKAINYSMTSFFTTGGIRGGKQKMDKFYPRSFNMGIKREVINTLGGFSKMRFGEDIDLSIRIVKGGFKSCLFSEAWVYHKRRTDLKKFFKQVNNSGIARINLFKKYPESLKLVHLLPALFTFGVAFCLLLICMGILYGILNQTGIINIDFPGGPVMVVLGMTPLLLFSLIIFLDASIRNKSLEIGLLAIKASFIQLLGYGSGFIRAWWKRCVKQEEEFEAFKKNFYK